MVGEVCPTLFQNICAQGSRIGGVPFFNRNRQVADLPRHDHFQRVGFRLGAESGGKQLITDPAE